MEGVISNWRWRNLTLSGKITVFKSLVFSKIVFISYLNSVPKGIESKIEQIQKKFIWEGKRPKIKHLTLICDYSDGGLKSLDIHSKLTSLKLCWIKRLYDSNFHPWKNIPLKLIQMNFGQTNIFYPNAQLNFNSKFPIFYQNIAKEWSNHIQEPLTVTNILSQYVWYNNFIKIDSKNILRSFNFDLFVNDLYENGSLIPFEAFRSLHNLDNKDFFKWRQIVSAIPARWKANILNKIGSDFSREQHALFLSRQIPTDRLTSKQIYQFLTYKIIQKPTSQTKITSILEVQPQNWKKIYCFGIRVSIDSKCRIFHFKTSHNILYLNKILNKMNLSDSPLCSYCNSAPETIVHLFCHCPIIRGLWNEIKSKINLPLPDLTPESAFFGFYNSNDILVGHIHLIFKMSIYAFRIKKYCSSLIIFKKIKNIFEIEKKATFLFEPARIKNSAKWARISYLFSSQRHEPPATFLPQ